ncbi:MAG: hypothetical protein QNJ46_07970 [Leptolyngbyaceae cyanobacterium MO_188.B28]|nr:hypothetical protein [Leptolyngbyaceae cyanobacterium MO_188.B28]
MKTAKTLEIRQSCAHLLIEMAQSPMAARVLANTSIALISKLNDEQLLQALPLLQSYQERLE